MPHAAGAGWRHLGRASWDCARSRSSFANPGPSLPSPASHTNLTAANVYGPSCLGCLQEIEQTTLDLLAMRMIWPGMGPNSGSILLG